MKSFWFLRRRPETIAREVDEELQAHLDRRTDELCAAGWSEIEARREAARQFGDLDATRRYCRDQDRQKEHRMRFTLLIEDLVQDLRICLRGLVRAPVAAAVVVTTVGLGIGATTAVFSAIDAALLRPLPYAEPDRLVRIYTDTPPFKFSFSVADYLALQEQQKTFAGIAGYRSRTMTMADGSGAERIIGREVTTGYFDLLGIQPALGRPFADQEGKTGSANVVIVSHGFWQRRLGADASAVGRQIRLDGSEHTVIGVLPAAVGPLERAQDFFVPARWTTPPRRGPFFITVLARLRQPGDLAAADDDIKAINRRTFPIWKAGYQDDRATWSMMPLATHVVGDVRAIAGLSLAAVALVWLVACANASNLLIARVGSRRRELAVRTALGATRGRVIRHLLSEGALLGVGAAILGAAAAWSGMQLLRDAGAGYFPRTQEIAFDATALSVLIGLTLFSALLFGLIPAMQGSGIAMDAALRSEGRSTTAAASVRRMRRVLVGAQFAIATPLLIVAALLMGSVRQLERVDLGFDTKNIVTGNIQLPPGHHAGEGQAAAFWDELERRIRAIPGVTGTAFADGRPPDDVGDFNNFDLQDAPTPPGQSQPVVPFLRVTPDYFRVLGIRLLEGRLLDKRDAQGDDGPYVVVDHAWAKRFFPNGSAVGRRLRSGGCTDCDWTTVVGVVNDVKLAGIGDPDRGAVYPNLRPDRRFSSVFLRTAGDPATTASALRQAVRALDPTLAVSSVLTIDELAEQSLARPRSLSMLIGSLAVAALLLSIIGIYGVMAYYVQQQTKEIGIRLALGGTRREVIGLVVGQGMRVVGVGILAGTGAALYLTRYTTTLIFGVGPRDPIAFAVVCGVLTAAALVGCFIPARRAATLQPAEVLRDS